MTRWAVLLLPLGLWACTPDVPEGTFRCSLGRCPNGFVCAGDLLCYDGQGGALLGATAPCGGDAECAGGAAICALGPDLAASEGYCSVECNDDEECAGVGDAGGECFDGECLALCDPEADECPEGTRCFLPAPEMGEPLGTRGLCFSATGRPFVEPEACGSGDLRCPSSMSCIRPSAPESAVDAGVCLLRCLGSDNCPGEGIQACVDVFEGGMTAFCLQRCTVAEGCPDQTELVCAAVEDAGDTFCVPEAWSFEARGGEALVGPAGPGG